MAQLPKDLKPLFWSYDFSKIDSKKHYRLIIVNVLNYGELDHWKWLIKTYGKEKLKKIIKEIPASEFRKPVLRLLSLFFGIRNLKYASRSDKIRAEKNI